jgi:hypothetical protein
MSKPSDIIWGLEANIKAIWISNFKSFKWQNGKSKIFQQQCTFDRVTL